MKEEGEKMDDAGVEDFGVSAGDKPECQLMGGDGNVFAIIGTVSSSLKQAGLTDKAKEFTGRAFNAGSYDEVLAMTFEYVDVL
jgi:hypothetical protein